MRVFCAFFVFVLWQQAALANVPNQFSVQGVLRAGGQLQSMPFNLTVKLYNDRTSTDAAALLGTPVNAQMVGATNGLFTIAINADQALMTRLATASQVWLEVTAGNDTFPRQLVTPDVYALMCGNADTVTNGVYTNGSYANPAWITALAGSKITGAVANATNAVNANTATNATALGGVPPSGYATNPHSHSLSCTVRTASSASDALANCQGAEICTGGGCSGNPTVISAPTGTPPSGWRCRAQDLSVVNAFAVCCTLQ